MKKFSHVDGKKQCSCCGQWLPATYEFFVKDSRRWDGFTNRCKKCRKGGVCVCFRKHIRQSREERLCRQKIFRDKNRLNVLCHYSPEGNPVCACCGERRIEFLVVDHIEGGGSQHRKSIGGATGSAFYYWLISNKYPNGYQILCHNCNFAKSHGGCPHSREK